MPVSEGELTASLTVLYPFPLTVNSYGQPQPSHLFSGPSPMYQISTQDSPGYNRPGKR